MIGTYLVHGRCTCLWYRLITCCLVHVGAWLMHMFMVQVGAWLIHLFKVQDDYRPFGTCWCMVDALVYGIG